MHFVAMKGCQQIGNEDPPDSADRFQWVVSSGGVTLPNAVVGGYENGHDLFVCRARYKGVHPGKIVGTNCNISWGGAEMSFDKYEALVSANPGKWVPASNGSIPPGAFVAGHEPDRKLILCRAPYNGGVHPGKIVGGTCDFGWGGQEMYAASYEVLVP
jgi:hypothetical protein